MKTRNIFLLCVVFLSLILVVISTQAGGVFAAPGYQGFVTSTPGPDGRILYTVADGDNCSSIALAHGITVTQLRQFNTRLDDTCTVSPGQQLVVGLQVADSGPTPGPFLTPTLPVVTPTPIGGTTEVCILLFDDVNGDALRQETEFGIAGGAVSLTNLNGSYSQAQNTTADIDPDLIEPIRTCFTNVPPGQYSVSMAIPDGYNPTMSVGYTLEVQAGDRASIDFGAQSKTVTIDEGDEGGGKSIGLGLFGILLLLGGVGLGYYAYRSGQPKSKLKGSPLMKR